MARIPKATTGAAALSAQTHRSWWVAKDAVERARREGVKGSVEAPVSRPNVRPLREAGWF